MKIIELWECTNPVRAPVLVRITARDIFLYSRERKMVKTRDFFRPSNAGPYHEY